MSQNKLHANKPTNERLGMIPNQLTKPIRFSLCEVVSLEIRCSINWIFKMQPELTGFEFEEFKITKPHVTFLLLRHVQMKGI